MYDFIYTNQCIEILSPGRV